MRHKEPGSETHEEYRATSAAPGYTHDATHDQEMSEDAPGNDWCGADRATCVMEFARQSCH